MKYPETYFKFTFIVVTIVAMAMAVDFRELISLLAVMSVPMFLIVCFIVTLDQAFMGAKWHYLLKVFHVVVPFSVPVMAYLRGRIYQFIAPSNLGIDAYKTYYVNRFHKKTTSIVSSILVERGFGTLSSLAILLIMLPFCVDLLDIHYRDFMVWISLFGFVCIVIIVHLIQSNADILVKVKLPRFFPDRAHDIFENMVVNLAKVKGNKKTIWVYFLISIVEKTFYGMAVYFSVKTIGLTEPGFLFVMSVAPVLALLERLPISVSAIGVREGLFYMLFVPYYKDPTIAITVSLVLRTAEIVQVLLFLFPWFIGRNRQAIDNEIQSVKSNYPSDVR